MTAFTDVCAKLDARKSGGTWKAICPAHEDKNPSLAIAEGAGGRVLLTCHAGCSFADVLRAAGLQLSDLYDGNGRPQPKAKPARGEPPKAPKAKTRGREVKSYPYQDEAGQHLYSTVRYDPKDFSQRRADGAATLKGCRRVIYRLPDLQGKSMVVAVEGEKDADALWNIDIPATSSVCGAGHWTNPKIGRDSFGYGQQLRAAGCREVIIIPDNDPAGQLHAEQIRQSCEAVGLRPGIVRLPGLPDKGADVSNYLKTFSAESLRKLLADAFDRLSSGETLSLQPSAPSILDFKQTDIGNGEYFAALYGEGLRFDHRRGKWYVWQDHYWRLDDDGTALKRLEAAIRDRQHRALRIDDDLKKQSAISWALKSENRGRLDNALWAAQRQSPCSIVGNEWNQQPHVLGCPNGVVDLQTGQLRPGRPEDLINQVTAVPFDPSASCPRWRQFIREICSDDRGNLDEDREQYLQRAAGYSATGDTTEQLLFAIYGSGSNGKTTVLRALRYVLGDYGHVAGFSTFEYSDRSAIPTDLAQLVDRRFVMASETNDGRRLNEARIKDLTGGDPISARHLYQEAFEFSPLLKLWLAFNHRPIVRDDSHGFWRRVRLIPFTRRFEKDRQLEADLLREAPGILVWLVEGARDWYAHGLPPCEAIDDATTDYQRESDPLGEFIDTYIEEDPAGEVRAADLYDHYVLYATKARLGPKEQLTATMFGRLARRRWQRDDKNHRFYRGITRLYPDGPGEG